MSSEMRAVISHLGMAEVGTPSSDVCACKEQQCWDRNQSRAAKVTQSLEDKLGPVKLTLLSSWRGSSSWRCLADSTAEFQRENEGKHCSSQARGNKDSGESGREFNTSSQGIWWVFSLLRTNPGNQALVQYKALDPRQEQVGEKISYDKKICNIYDILQYFIY